MLSALHSYCCRCGVCNVYSFSTYGDCSYLSRCSLINFSIALDVVSHPEIVCAETLQSVFLFELFVCREPVNSTCCIDVMCFHSLTIGSCYGETCDVGAFFLTFGCYGNLQHLHVGLSLHCFGNCYCFGCNACNLYVSLLVCSNLYGKSVGSACLVGELNSYFTVFRL